MVRERLSLPRENGCLSVFAWQSPGSAKHDQIQTRWFRQDYNHRERRRSMSKLKFSAVPWVLPVGDGLVLLGVTLAGFANHNSSLADARWLATFLPLCLGWALVAPWLGNYEPGVTIEPRQAWRALLAMVLASPFAAFVRAALLNGTVIPIFVVALGGVSALALAAWRLAWALLAQRGFAWTKLR
jgi:hypothetical protein